ncbi:C4-dicarboxylate ABC transporter permease [Piscinibacter gummiphilus]|uniref:TRAP transporter small permease protein n=2 Tax=Piscinibacter gummiphilus TaxID=946333 RepID=A0A1W6LGF2_9BURK|nr:TRAP transporter small permease [Piscinibacter gummiphilus]ARN23293.1 C4-dicarboxylate ABC transporter permease [Piscinibacter gummiphilus]ATU67994.1 TRAP transporter small permease [Piscinibacter gummiphilus]GLS97287.1 C4-dicarboxylate ABC transporter permease [Piscinibacter gummiphilus]
MSVASHSPAAPVTASSPPNLFTRTCTFIAKACLNIGVVGMVLLVIAVLYQVFGRYIMNDTPTWAETSAILLVLYVTMLGVAVGVHDAGHIGLESFLVLAPEWLRLKLEILIHALVLLFGLTMAWQCGILSESVWEYKLPTLGISEAFRYIPAVMAGILIALFSFEHIVALVRGTEVEPAWH